MDDNENQQIQYVENGTILKKGADIVNKRNSVVGILSFIFGIINIMFMLGIFLASIQAKLRTGEPTGILIIIGLMVFAIILFGISGVILGIIGVCKKDTKKVFAILGLIFNAVITCFLFGLLMIGILAKKY